MDQSKDVVTVIVPVYNAQQYISDCIESILRQIIKIWKSYWLMTAPRISPKIYAIIIAGWTAESGLFIR